jgi:RNA 3'-terminal phosphate cyclase
MTERSGLTSQPCCVPGLIVISQGATVDIVDGHKGIGTVIHRDGKAGKTVVHASVVGNKAAATLLAMEADGEQHDIQLGDMQHILLAHNLVIDPEADSATANSWDLSTITHANIAIFKWCIGFKA